MTFPQDPYTINIYSSNGIYNKSIRLDDEYKQYTSSLTGYGEIQWADGVHYRGKFDVSK